MTPPNPNLLTIQNYHILETRNRKLLKLCIMKDKPETRRSIVHEQADDDSEGQMILSQLNNSHYSEVSSDKSQQSQHASYDSQPYNTYQILQSEGREKKPANYFNLKATCDHLVWEFKSEEDVPKINIILPAPLPLQKITNTIAVQTIPMEIPHPQKKIQRQIQQKKQKQKSIKQKSRQKQKSKSKAPFIPQLKRQLPSSPEALGIKSEIKTENAILTQSIEMIRPIKQSSKKTTSFMEYYNSVPVKKPSNILEKFIKRKK